MDKVTVMGGGSYKTCLEDEVIPNGHPPLLCLDLSFLKLSDFEPPQQSAR